MLPGGPLLPFNPAISFCLRGRDSFLCTGFIIANNGKPEKILLCSLAVRRAKRISNPRVGSIRPAGLFDVLCPPPALKQTRLSGTDQKIGSCDQKIGFTFHVP